MLFNWRSQDVNIKVVFTSLANRTLKSSGTQTPITFPSKSALTSCIVLTRILNTIALIEEKNRCHCHYYYNHFHNLLLNATIINIILVIIIVLLFLYFSINFKILGLWRDFVKSTDTKVKKFQARHKNRHKSEKISSK